MDIFISLLQWNCFLIRKKVIFFCWKGSYISNFDCEVYLKNKSLIQALCHSVSIRSSRLIDGNSDAGRTHRRIRVGCLMRVREGRYARFHGAKFRSRRSVTALSFANSFPGIDEDQKSSVVRSCAKTFANIVLLNANVNCIFRAIHAKRRNAFTDSSGKNRSERFSGQEQNKYITYKVHFK